MNQQLKASLLLLLSMGLFSLLGPIVRLSSLHVLVFMFFYTSLASLLYFGFFVIKRRTKELFNIDWKWILFNAVVAFLTYAAYLQAFKLTTLANAVLLHYTAPVFALLFGVWLLKEKPVNATILAMLISFAGLFIIFSSQVSLGENLVGLTFALLSGLFYGLIIVTNKKVLEKHSSGVVMFYQMIVSAIIVIPFLFLESFSITSNDVIAIGLYVVFVLLIAALIFLYAVRFLKSPNVAIIGYVEPLLVVFYGVFFFSEPLTSRTIIGGLLILFSGYLVVKDEAKKPTKTKQVQSS